MRFFQGWPRITDKKLVEQVGRGQRLPLARQACLTTTLCGSNDITEVTDEIESALEVLALPKHSFIKLPESESRVLFNDLVVTFVEGGDRKWWWEAFKQGPVCTISGFSKPYELLVSLVPDVDEKLWFIVEDNYSDHYPIYEGDVRLITSVIEECFAFEYYLVPKNKEWLLCENHHNVLLGVGERIINNELFKSAT